MSKVEIILGDLLNSCFVVMPFDPVFDPEYANVICPAIKDAGLSPARADQLVSKPGIMADIWKALRSSRLVIAEVSGKNANVFYEVGLAHALGKPVIVITRERDDVPFDLKALRYVYYEITSPSWGDSLKQKITEMIKNVLKEKEYGTALEGITAPASSEYKPVTEAESKALPVPCDTTGVWEGQMTILEKNIYDLELKLKQTKFDLEGTLTVKEQFGEYAIIQESIKGLLMGDVVSLYGVSYTYLRQRWITDYNLDSYQGKISDDCKLISGACDDTGGQKGTFSFKRCP